MNVIDAIDACYAPVYDALDEEEFFVEGYSDLFKKRKPPLVKLKEYVVINSLPLTNNQLQTGYLNLNIHVKDIEPGKPNFERLQEIYDIVKVIFPIYSEDLNIKINAGDFSLMEDETANEHFLNIRLRVIILNDL